MKIAGLFIAMVLLVSTNQVANAQSGNKHAGHDHAGHAHAGHDHAGHDHAAPQNKLSERDQLRVAVQEICPISGEKLGSMGQPMKVKVGQETIFVCCKGCLKGKIDPKHWATIHANFAKAQRICPVMENEIPKNPKWTIVEGQIIYVCCPPCTKKIDANPAKFLADIDKLYSASLKERQSHR